MNPRDHQVHSTLIPILIIMLLLSSPLVTGQMPFHSCAPNIVPSTTSYFRALPEGFDLVFFCAAAFEAFGPEIPFYGHADQTLFISCFPLPEILMCPPGYSSACDTGFPCILPCAAKYVPNPVFVDNYIAFALTTVHVEGDYDSYERNYVSVVSNDYIVGEQTIEIGDYRWVTQRTPTGVALRNGLVYFDLFGERIYEFTDAKYEPAPFPKSGIPASAILIGYGEGVAYWELKTGGLFTEQPLGRIQFITTIPVLRGTYYIVTPLKIIRDYEYSIFQTVHEETTFIQFDELNVLFPYEQKAPPPSQGGFFPDYQFKLSDWV